MYVYEDKGSRIFQSVSMFLSETVASQSTRCVQSSVESINSLVFFNDQCDHVTSKYRSQLQAMNRAQFAKTSKTNSVIY